MGWSIVKIQGDAENGKQSIWKFETGYNDFDPNHILQNSIWENIPINNNSSSVSKIDNVYGDNDTPATGKRTPCCVAIPDNQSMIKCTAIIYDTIQQKTVNIIGNTVIMPSVSSPNILIEQEYIFSETISECDTVPLKIKAVDENGPVSFDSMTVNGSIVFVPITGVTEKIIRKPRSGEQQIIQIFRMGAPVNALVVNRDIIPLFPATIPYSLVNMDIEILLDNVQCDFGEGGGWEQNTKHSFISVGSKTIKVADIYGCTRIFSVTAQMPGPVDLDSFESTFYNSKANSLRFVEQVEFDDCTVYPKDENIFGCEDEYLDIAYLDKQRVKKCFNIKHQFNSGYDTHIAKIYYANGVLYYTPAITKVQKNIKFLDERNYLYFEDDFYSYIYFETSRNIPYFYEIGGEITIGSETKQILNIEYLENYDIWAIKTEKFASYSDINVQYTYNKQIFDVYEFSIWNDNIPDGEFYVEIEATRTSSSDPSQNKTVKYRSLNYITAESFEKTVDIRYYNNRNNDIYWASGYVGFITIGLDYRIAIGETENSVSGTDDSSYLERAYGREKFRFLFEPLTLEMARKLTAALSQYSVFINEQRYAFDSVTIESIGEYTNLYIVKGDGYKTQGDNYAIEELGSYIGGIFGDIPLEILHRECGTLRNLQSRNVNVVFNEPFPYVPQGVANLRVYRLVFQYGLWIAQDVVHSFTGANWLTPVGFGLIIDASEALDTVEIEYCFF